LSETGFVVPIIATPIFGRYRVNVNWRWIFASAVFVLFGFAQFALSTDLRVVVLSNKNGRPQHRKKVCVDFSANPKLTALLRPEVEVCRRTDAQGSATIPVPGDPQLQWLYVRILTNDFVECFIEPSFIDPGRFSTPGILKFGAVAPNTCGPNTVKNPANVMPQPGSLVLYGHQMSLREVLNSIRGEL
jgi:hypothetical protein